MTRTRLVAFAAYCAAGCVLLMGCSAQRDWLSRQRAWRTERQELTKIAGRNAEDCGYIRFGKDPKQANRCALESLAQKKPFYVAYDVQGMDSHLIIGLALDKTPQFFTVKYDSMGWDPSGVELPERVIGHVFIKPCQDWHLQVTPRGYLSCDWPRNS